MKTINYQGRDVEAQEVDTVTSEEKWNEYQLSDGTVLQLKTEVIKIFRALHEKNNEGDPLYLTQSQTIVKVRTAQ